MFKILKNKIKKSIGIAFTLFSLITLIFLSACTIYPAPPNSATGNGNIQIYSEPIGASIFLDGSDTGYKSPELIKNISANGYLVTLKLEGYLNSNNFVQVYPNQTSQLNVNLTPNPYLTTPYPVILKKIEVEPESLSLSIGNTGKVDSITAHYSDETGKNIPPDQCFLYSTKPHVAIVTPEGNIHALSKGQTNIWIEYTESNITKSDNILIDVYEPLQDPGNLTSIVVLPSTMSLGIGESKAVSSITARYDTGLEQTINPNDCNFSVNNSVVSVSNSGIISGNSEGNSVVTVTYTEKNISKTDNISISVSDTIVSDSKYRALAIGVGDYLYYGEEGDLVAPPYDVSRMNEIFNDCQFGTNNIEFSKIKLLKDTQATKSNILQGIQSTFSGANNNDISYFYFSGHGATLNQVSYLCPADFNGETYTAISVDELESALSAIPGTKIVFIDSCHSGGFIGKSIFENTESENYDYLTDFNESIINVFANKPSAKDLLTSDNYQVLTSSHWYEVSYEIYPDTGEPFGVFTQALYEGCSLPNNTPADLNQNDQITLQEAYDFISQWVRALGIKQNVQVHPINSSFPIFDY